MADFLCFGARLVIEVDEGQHYGCRKDEGRRGSASEKGA
jgi:very-short-patch-repair endonuclease